MYRPIVTCEWVNGTKREYSTINAKYITRISRLFKNQSKGTEYRVELEMKSLAFSELEVGSYRLEIGNTLSDNFETENELHCTYYCYYPSQSINSEGRDVGEVGTAAENIYITLKTKGECTISLMQVFEVVQEVLDESENCSYFWEEPSIF
jgi:hypothetical protein